MCVREGANRGTEQTHEQQAAPACHCRSSRPGRRCWPGAVPRSRALPSARCRSGCRRHAQFFCAVCRPWRRPFCLEPREASVGMRGGGLGVRERGGGGRGWRDRASARARARARARVRARASLDVHRRRCRCQVHSSRASCCAPVGRPCKNWMSHVTSVDPFDKTFEKSPKNLCCCEDEGRYRTSRAAARGQNTA